METTTPSTSAGREVLERFFAAAESGDEEGAAACVHPDVVMSWPQSGERFTGRENALAAMAATEVKPEPVGEPRIVGAGNVWVMTMPLRYGSDISHYVGIFEIEGGQVRRTTEYFASPFPAQEARARFVDESVVAESPGEVPA